MTYNAKSKYQIRVGQILKGYSENYLITSIHKEFGTLTTQVIFKDNTKGTHIYFQPYSYYYGCKIDD